MCVCVCVCGSAQNGVFSCRTTCTMSFHIPPGLTAMLQDFTVAVLRTKPPDLYKFAAEHFTKLYAQKCGGSVPAPETTAEPPEKQRRDSKKVKATHAGFAASPTGKVEADVDDGSRGPSPGNLYKAICVATTVPDLRHNHNYNRSLQVATSHRA